MKDKNKHLKSGTNSLCRNRAPTNDDFDDSTLKKMSTSSVSRFLSSRVWKRILGLILSRSSHHLWMYAPGCTLQTMGCWIIPHTHSPWGPPILEWRRWLSEILKETPQNYKNRVIWAWLVLLFNPKRYHFGNETLTDKYSFCHIFPAIPVRMLKIHVRSFVQTV